LQTYFIIKNLPWWGAIKMQKPTSPKAVLDKKEKFFPTALSFGWHLH